MNIELEHFREQLSLMALEKELSKLPQLEAPLVHTFSGGVYIRQMLIPRNSLIIGKRHRFETCNILMEGTLLLYMGKDKEPQRIDGPFMFTSPPGTKKMALCLDEAIFLNIHPTDKTDLAEIEKEFIIPDDEYLSEMQVHLEDKEKKLCLGAQ